MRIQPLKTMCMVGVIACVPAYTALIYFTGDFNWAWVGAVAGVGLLIAFAALGDVDK